MPQAGEWRSQERKPLTLYTDLNVDGTKFRVVLMLCFFTALALVGLLFGPAPSASAAGDFSEEEIQFQSGDVTLRGTILVPDEASSSNSRTPAIALVHGAGPGPREQTWPEAEAFAREGVVTLIYDKRTEGYSQLERSYELLADDALAAARALRARPEVDREAIGLWGLSEGGWVVPMAAARSEGREHVAFVVLVAASGVPPVRQHAWNLENELRHQGVSGSMVEAIPRTGTRLLVGADLFAEAYHDPVEPLEQVRQPVLALWGGKDRIQPPEESARIVGRAFERGGNEDYTIRFFPEAEHGLRSSPDGFAIHERFVPGYPETVASWVKESAKDAASGGIRRNRAHCTSPSMSAVTPDSDAMVLVLLLQRIYVSVARYCWRDLDETDTGPSHLLALVEETGVEDRRVYDS